MRKKKYDIKLFGGRYGFYQLNKKGICHLEKTDKRNETFKQFKKQNGFTPDETWQLYFSIAVFVLPRLKYFREHTCGFPASFEKIEDWQAIIDKMIFSFQTCFHDDFFQVPKQFKDKYKNKKNPWKSYVKEVNEGFNLFGKYFLHLWW